MARRNDDNRGRVDELTLALALGALHVVLEITAFAGLTEPAPDIYRILNLILMATLHELHARRPENAMAGLFFGLLATYKLRAASRYDSQPCNTLLLGT